jgi:hypothetical protein
MIAFPPSLICTCSTRTNCCPPFTQPPKNLNLHRICFEQTRRSRSERCNPPLCSKSAIKLGENCHGCGVGAGQLHGQRCLYLVSRRCSFDHSESGIDGFLKLCQRANEPQPEVGARSCSQSHSRPCQRLCSADTTSSRARRQADGLLPPWHRSATA